MMAAAFLVTAVAPTLYYLSSEHQRWLDEPLPAWASRISALLAAIVGLRAWIEVLPAVSALFAWLTSLMFISVITAAASASLRRA